MTKKRYYRTFVNLEDNQHNPYYNIRDKTKDGNNILFMVTGRYTSKDIVDLLNEQDAVIKRLKKENQGLQFKIMDMLDFVKEKGTVTREEIKKWWNGDVMLKIMKRDIE